MIVQGTIFVTKGFPEFHSVRCCRFACRGHLAGVKKANQEARPGREALASRVSPIRSTSSPGAGAEQGGSDRKHLTSREVARLIEATKAAETPSATAACFSFMFRHCLRVSEACGLKLDQVDTESHVLKGGPSTTLLRHKLNASSLPRKNQGEKTFSPSSPNAVAAKSPLRVPRCCLAYVLEQILR
jgi:integrase